MPHNWSEIENVATRLKSQAEGANALLALVSDARQVETVLRESESRLASVQESLRAAQASLEGVIDARDRARAETERLRAEAVRQEEAQAQALRAFQAGLDEHEAAERARTEARLAEYRAYFDIEHERLRKELEQLEGRVDQAAAHLAALKGV